jgi:hypothetical protein
MKKKAKDKPAEPERHALTLQEAELLAGAAYVFGISAVTALVKEVVAEASGKGPNERAEPPIDADTRRRFKTWEASRRLRGLPPSVVARVRGPKGGH